MFKVSHELPINMLDKSFEINDYEYCLPHLLDQNETYRRHFENAKESGSYIIMDNSLQRMLKITLINRSFTIPHFQNW